MKTGTSNDEPYMGERKINILLIINGCLEKNQNSQRKLYEHFYGFGMSIALRYSKSKDEALEILNDAFLKVFNKLDRYDKDYPFGPWLKKIIVNAAIDYYRKMHREPAKVDIEDIKEPSIQGFDLPEISSDIDMLPIIQQLTPKYRMVFNLYVMEGYKHHEIAEMLQISVATSKSNLSRAKQKLRTAWLQQHGKKVKRI